MHPQLQNPFFLKKKMKSFNLEKKAYYIFTIGEIALSG